MVESVGVGGQGAKFNVTHAQAGVFLINPKAVITAIEANHFNQLGRCELADSKKPNHFSSSQFVLDLGHFLSSRCRNDSDISVARFHTSP
jgi:hypothetical protein